jgi:protein tyrosine phosphatase (PTP) superfamily phosphohydrolase (DUF442 family)
MSPKGTARFKAAILVLLVATVWVAAGSQTSPGPAPAPVQHSMGRKLTMPGLPNLGEVTPLLYRGAQPTREGIESLQKMGIDVVVNLRGGRNDAEEATVTQRGMHYVAIPSRCQFPRDETFARFLAVVRENPGKKIFVHCQLGEDRTGMAVASYRMEEEGWNAGEAMKEMQAFGFSSTHYLTCPGLASYEERFPERLKSQPAFKELRGAQPAK